MAFAVGIIIGAVIFILGAFVAPIFAAFGEDSTAAKTATALSTTVAEVLAAVFIYRLILKPLGVTGWLLGLRPPLRDSDSGLRSFSLGWLGTVVGACFLAFVILFAYVAIVSGLGLDVLEPPEQQFPEELFTHWLVIVALGLSVLLAAPIFEELFFRGFVFSAVRKSSGLLPAAIVSGLLFSLAHFDLGFILPFGLIGAWFAFLYWRTDSLYTSMLCHFLFNFVGFVALVARETGQESESLSGLRQVDQVAFAVLDAALRLVPVAQ